MRWGVWGKNEKRTNGVRNWGILTGVEIGGVCKGGCNGWCNWCVTGVVLSVSPFSPCNRIFKPNSKKEFGAKSILKCFSRKSNSFPDF